MSPPKGAGKCTADLCPALAAIPTMTPIASPRLLADIGGTCARFTFESAPGVFQHTASLRCAELSDIHAAISAYLAGLP